MRHQAGDDVVVVSRSSLTKSLLRVPVRSRSPGWTRRSSFPHHPSRHISFQTSRITSGVPRQCTIALLSNGDRFRTVWSTLVDAESRKGLGHGSKREVFFLNLEDGYFGCQVNESTDVLQLLELSKLCDHRVDCYQGVDEQRNKLKCTGYHPAVKRLCISRRQERTIVQKKTALNVKMVSVWIRSVTVTMDSEDVTVKFQMRTSVNIDPVIYLPTVQILLAVFNVPAFPDTEAMAFIARVIILCFERPRLCIRFIINDIISLDINECDDPAIARRCVENAECCNLPSNFLCQCKSGYIGNGEVHCEDVNECTIPGACGDNTVCHNIPGNYTCTCQDGFTGDPFNSVSTLARSGMRSQENDKLEIKVDNNMPASQLPYRGNFFSDIYMTMRILILIIIVHLK
ncbi:Nidogen-2 [Trachymyrmex cornetzi]|uniref:Nidogen-2 n=1 Tax=Trachymyrmex cornetzi TaxID=471704 RepID=A0A195DJF2_9HYME|nr:Nidogen-2 [Trachymyrmex cornetzi]